MTDVDRRAVFFERPLDDIDRSFDPGTKASGFGQYHPHDLASSPCSGSSSRHPTGIYMWAVLRPQIVLAFIGLLRWERPRLAIRFRAALRSW
jgi:hypothetical protein